ncbi:MAG: LysM peptidoglycan-binding domain-containing protein [archaeon]|nr:LysM peptidoglycan-binding domain-containing protein [archaeon]
MSKNWKRKTVLAMLLAALIGTAILPALGHPLIQRSASAASDPIAVGNSYQDQYDAIIIQYANANGLNPFLVKGQIMVESNFDTYALSHLANAGCGWTHDEGLMQINPYCSATGSANLFNAWTNIQLGTGFMATLYHQFGSYDLALQAYNIGPNAVANGQRNWAYSNAVDGYAQQFESEHSSLMSGSGSSQPSSSGTYSAVTYTVQSGDYLYLIGQRYGVSWQSIASANGIYSPYTIYVGEKLTISGASVTQYTVRPGDYLYSIGQRYGVSWQSIASANGISAPYIIYVGEVLTIP